VRTAATPAEEQTAEEIEIARMMRSRFSSVASDIMPKVAELGVRAKVALGVALAMARKRSRAGSEAEAPRRMTSPPPTGALHATGKRVVREGADKQEPAPRENRETRARLGKKGMVMAGGATGLLVISLVAMFSRSSSPPPGAKGEETEVSAVPVGTASDTAPPNGALEAKVPLFGTTTIATTEVASLPAPSAPTQGVTGSPANRSFSSEASVVQGDAPGRKQGERPDADSAGSRSPGKAASFGHGKVEHATVLRIKTDGTVSDLRGVRSSSGFTLTLPGRRTLDSGSALAARDPRITSVRVSNGAKGSELTFQFKSGVPAFLVSPNGRDLQLALGRIDGGRDAKDVRRSPTANKREPAAHRPTKN
jgi:hypothetical protein